MRAAVERSSYTSSIAAIAPPSTARQPLDTDLPRRPLSPALPQLQARCRREALRLAAAGLPVVIVTPVHVLGRGDIYRSRPSIVAAIPATRAARILGTVRSAWSTSPTVARGHLPRVRVASVGGGTSSGIATTRWTACSPTSADECVDPPSRKLPLQARLCVRARASRRAALAVSGRYGSRGAAVIDVVGRSRSTKAIAARGYTPRHHDESPSRLRPWYREREPLSIQPP